MVRSLRRPPIRGTADPDLPGHVLVPVRAKVKGLPKVNYSVPDTSYWRVNKRSNKPVAIVTVTPDGVNLGWDNCGVCAHGVAHCDCASGISLPYSIEYIFISRGGRKPLPQPNAVKFRAPDAVSTPAPAPRKKPKRTLQPLREKAAAKEAEAQVDKTLRRLRRRTR